MVDPRTILIATTNRGKLLEVQAILADLPVTLVTLEAHPNIPEAIEDADTFEGNAASKALHYARLTQSWTLADDSGLVVDALGGAPGVHSARYAGPACDAAANNAKLIAALSGVPQEDRTARFYCAVALANPAEVLAVVVGVWEGVIIDEARGTSGFGYDPHFFVPSIGMTEGMTAAQMSSEQKNSVSHRGQALRAIRLHIERLPTTVEPT